MADRQTVPRRNDLDVLPTPDSCSDSELRIEPASDLQIQLGLDALVTRIAVELMSVSADSLDQSSEWVLRVMNEYFDVDTSFLRRTDRERDMSILVAEWPRRPNIPDPDPLGEVPFGADPAFDATRDLDRPFVIRPTASKDTYQELIEQASGISGVSTVMVPLIRDRTTVGVLGFVKFADRAWDAAETNALQAVASLVVHLQARVEAEDQLRYQAHHDDLTGLPNRRSLLEELERRLARGAGETLLVYLLDLDRFKAVNDYLGHEAGDQLLLTVARRLGAALEAGDFVARLAGGEFVVVLERPVMSFAGLVVAERLLGVIARSVEIGGHQVGRTASLGMAFGSGDPTTADDFLAHADAALHVSKAQGGNRATSFDAPMAASVKRRAETVLQLRNAIDEGGLLLHYQPEVDLRTGRLLAVEALVRWVHPERGVLSASEFIEDAEESGLTADLGRWVLAEACHQMAAWRVQYPLIDFTMRVNVSPVQLAIRGIVGLVNDCLQTHALPGHALCLEITEHAVVEDVGQAVQVLRDLKSLGISLAIDDFGTGYSSMAQLKSLPVDVLKIDQTFVAGLGTNAGDRAIVDATVRLARSFELAVVAEGVERPELVQELLDLECFRAQGFLLCRPKCAADLAPILLVGGVDPQTFAPSDQLVGRF